MYRNMIISEFRFIIQLSCFMFESVRTIYQLYWFIFCSTLLSIFFLLALNFYFVYGHWFFWSPIFPASFFDFSFMFVHIVKTKKIFSLLWIAPSVLQTRFGTYPASYFEWGRGIFLLDCIRTRCKKDNGSSFWMQFNHAISALVTRCGYRALLIFFHTWKIICLFNCRELFVWAVLRIHVAVLHCPTWGFGVLVS